MKRLIIFTAAALALCSCEQGSKSGGEKSQISRVNAVQAPAETGSTDNWCDVSFAPEKAPNLELPPLSSGAGGAFGGLPKKSWVWLNLWATWCKPCVREMPLLIRWKELLRGQGVAFDVAFMSVDDDPKNLSDYLRANPNVAKETVARLTSPDALPEWLKKYGLDPNNANVPIQVIADANGKVRCVRAGSINDGDWRTVQSLIK